MWDAGVRPETITLNIDATLLSAHSENELAAGNYKHAQRNGVPDPFAAIGGLVAAFGRYQRLCRGAPGG